MCELCSKIFGLNCIFTLDFFILLHIRLNLCLVKLTGIQYCSCFRKPCREMAEALNAPKQESSKGKQEMPIKCSRERSRSREYSRHRSSRSRSRSRGKTGTHYSKHRSSSRDRSYRSHRRSRSRSRGHSSRYRGSYSHSRSRSRSRERSSRSGRKRSHSPEHMGQHHRGQSSSKEFRSKRSPDGRNKTSKYASNSLNSSSTEAVNYELTRKRRELLELNELIERKKAIITMEQNAKTPSQFKDTLEMDDQLGIATFDYQHKTCAENSWIPDMKPVRSILKKHSESLTSPQHQVGLFFYLFKKF